MEKLVLCLCVLIFAVTAQRDYVGQDCKTSGEPGICVYINNCPIAVYALKVKHNHTLKRCGFDGFIEIVCCPKVSIKNPIIIDDNDDNSESNEYDDRDRPNFDTNHQNRFTKRRAEQVCEEISNDVAKEINFHIIGGENAENDEFPHMAALGYESGTDLQFDCGATLISEKFLLTAAHCLNRLEPTVARLGVTRLDDSTPRDIPIRLIKIHDDYSTETKHNDIALIELSQPVTFSKKIRPACLYSEPGDPLGLIVTGWGKRSIGSEDDRSNILQKATLYATSLTQCNETYSLRSNGLKTIDSTQLCAASNKSDSCWGDSGGPLQIRKESGAFAVVGVISYGAGCGGKAPGVYSRVYKYLDWIERNVWPQ